MSRRSRPTASTSAKPARESPPKTRRSGWMLPTWASRSVPWLPAVFPVCAGNSRSNALMPVTIARGGTGNVEIIVGHPRAMFCDMGHRDSATLDAMSDAFRSWVARKIEAGEYLSWFAIAEDGSVAAGLGLWLMDWLPHLIGPGVPRGNIVNVYT